MSQILLNLPVHAAEKPSSWTALELLSVGLVCTFLAWYAQFHWNRRRLYQLSRNVPGFFAWPVIGNAIMFMGSNDRILENVMKVFRAFPNVGKAWLGPDLVIAISKPEYMEVIFNHPKSLAKMHLYKFAIKTTGEGLFASRSVKKWKRHRKIISPTFNQKILDRFVEVFSEQCFILIKRLKQVDGKGEFDLFSYITACTTDIVCETAMGVKMNVQTTNAQFGHKLDKCFEIMFLRMFNVYYHSDFIFNFTEHRRIEDQCVNALNELTDQVIKRKVADYREKQKNIELQDAEIEEDSKIRKAFLDLLIEEKSFTDKELRDEVKTFICAGSDTTASSNCFIFMCLGIHPDVQEKVYEEAIDIIGPPGAPVEHHHLPRLVYLERVIKETLRLFPVGAFVVRACQDDIALDKNYTCPKGCSVILGMLHVHRNPDYWPNPLEFNPDRFLPEEVTKLRHPYCYIPFSAGPRNCIGPKYAMMAMKSMVSTIVRSYKFKSGYKNVAEVALKKNLILRPQHGYKVSIEERRI